MVADGIDDHAAGLLASQALEIADDGVQALAREVHLNLAVGGQFADGFAQNRFELILVGEGKIENGGDGCDRQGQISSGAY